VLYTRTVPEVLDDPIAGVSNGMTPNDARNVDQFRIGTFNPPRVLIHEMAKIKVAMVADALSMQQGGQLSFGSGVSAVRFPIQSKPASPTMQLVGVG